MIQPYIFAGLGKPKSQLFFDLQAMIAANGGRLKLADIIESEMVKTPRLQPLYRQGRGNFVCYKDYEDEIILTNHGKIKNKNIALLLNRTLLSVDSRISVLRKKGLIPVF